MAITRLKRTSTGFTPIVALSVLLLVSLYLMSAATQNSEQFGRLYFTLLIINVLGLIALIAAIGANFMRLVRQYRNQSTGSRLTVRLVMIFVLLALAPVSVVYYFSVDFIQRGIDSWFDVRIEQALDDALELSRASLDARKRELLKRTESMLGDLALQSDDQVAVTLNDFRDQSDAYELTLLSSNGHIVASSSSNPAMIVPNLPNDAIMRQLRQGVTYIGLDPIPDAGLNVRIVTEIPRTHPIRVLQALYPVSGRMSELAASVQSAYARYEQLAYLRDPLKFSFTLTLSLVLLLSLLSAVWAAFFSARRLVAPIRVLAIGTRAVAAGDYSKHLPLHSNDDLGFLVQSFNAMTRKIAQARDAAKRSQLQAEGERAYLKAVLGRLSSGVLTLDRRHIIRTANAAASQILGLELKACLGGPLERVGQLYPYLTPLTDAIRSHLLANRQEWREEVVIFGANGRQVLTCAGTGLSGTVGRKSGHIIVFDDVTALVQAQRDAAWGEVARRLAHEIKNPLTPIQLSAERLRHKYLNSMDPKDAEVLDRSTHTIVQQVEGMKEMVKAFSEYALTPQIKLRPLDLNGIINEVLDLYRGDESHVRIRSRLGEHLPLIKADAGRLRQLLHNLIKNSLEAIGDMPGCWITIATDCIHEAGVEMLELRVQDNGPGIPEEMLGHLFEPYVTTKPKGSGLGLAIVKKIVEEHGGIVRANNLPHAGTAIMIQLPMDSVACGGAASGSRAGAAGGSQSNETVRIKRRKKA